MRTRSAAPQPDVVRRIPGPRMRRTPPLYPLTTPPTKRIPPQYDRTLVSTSSMLQPCHRTSNPTNNMLPIRATGPANKPPTSPRDTAPVTMGPRRATPRVTPITTAPASQTVMRGRRVRADVVRPAYMYKVSSTCIRRSQHV